jgi:hypothetical protein
MEEGWDAITTNLNIPSTFWCLSQARTWISYAIYIMSWSFFIFNYLRWEVIARFVDISGIVYHHRLYYLFIIHHCSNACLFTVYCIKILYCCKNNTMNKWLLLLNEQMCGKYYLHDLQMLCHGHHWLLKIKWKTIPKSNLRKMQNGFPQHKKNIMAHFARFVQQIQ